MLLACGEAALRAAHVLRAKVAVAGRERADVCGCRTVLGVYSPNAAEGRIALAVHVVPRGSSTRGSVSSTAMVAVDIDGCRVELRFGGDVSQAMGAATGWTVR